MSEQSTPYSLEGYTEGAPSFIDDKVQPGHVAVDGWLAEASESEDTADILDRLGLVASELGLSGDVDVASGILSYNIEGWHEEINEIALSPEKINQFIDGHLAVVDKLHQLGAGEKSKKVLWQITKYLSVDGPHGTLNNAIESYDVGDERLYQLFASVSRLDSKDQLVFFKHLTGINKFKFLVPSDNSDRRLSRAVDVFRRSMQEDDPETEAVQAMFVYALADSLYDEKKTDESFENPKLIRELLESYGLDEKQAGEVFEATIQSESAKKYRFDVGERFNRLLNLFHQLGTEGNEESAEAKEHIQTLYQKYGIRNFYRYQPSDLLPQLANDFHPDELVVTAVADENGAFEPPLSAEGLKYQSPVYFEAETPVDIARALLHTHKLREERTLKKALIGAHGSPKGFRLSKSKKNSSVEKRQIDRRKNGWESLVVEKGVVDIDAEIVFEACSLGAGGFPKSLYKSTGLENIFTSPKDILGLGSPAVIRTEEGGVLFGVGHPDSESGTRNSDELVSPAPIRSHKHRARRRSVRRRSFR